MRPSPRSLLVAASLVACGLATSPAAADDTKQACATAYVAAQHLRHEGKLRRAREQLQICASDPCPAAVRPDCARWLDEVEAATPTIVVEARDAAGRDRTDARVSVDGAVVAAQLDGRPLPIDPGSHVLRLELSDGASVEQAFVAREGERYRHLQVQLRAPGEARVVAPPAPAPASTLAPAPEPPRPARRSVAPYVLGGIGIAAMTVGAAIDVAAWAQYRHLQSMCGPGCSPGAAHGPYATAAAGDVVLGAGAAVTVAAVVWFFLAKPVAASDAAWVSPFGGPGLAGLAVGRAF